MSPITIIASHDVIGIPILTSQNDEEFGEEIAQLFIAHLNLMQRGEGPSGLCSAEWDHTGSADTNRVKASPYLSGEAGLYERFI